MQEIMQYGKGTVLVTKSDFKKGFLAGQVDYKATKALNPEPLTDEEIVDITLEKLEDIRLSSSYGIGFTAGFLLAIAEEARK